MTNEQTQETRRVKESAFVIYGRAAEDICNTRCAERDATIAQQRLDIEALARFVTVFDRANCIEVGCCDWDDEGVDTFHAERATIQPIIERYRVDGE